MKEKQKSQTKSRCKKSKKKTDDEEIKSPKD